MNQLKWVATQPRHARDMFVWVKTCSQCTRHALTSQDLLARAQTHFLGVVPGPLCLQVLMQPARCIFAQIWFGALDQMQYQGIKVMWIKMYKNMSAKDETFPSRLSWGSVWERVREKRDFRSLSAPPAPTSLSTPPRLSRWKETQVAKRKETLETFPNGRSHKETTCKARRDIRGKNKQRNWEWKAASDRLRRRMGDWQEGQYLLRAGCCHNIVILIFKNYLNISNISNIWEVPHYISKEL